MYWFGCTEPRAGWDREGGVVQARPPKKGVEGKEPVAPREVARFPDGQPTGGAPVGADGRRLFALAMGRATAGQAAARDWGDCETSGAHDAG